jgi:hypothetical protein
MELLPSRGLLERGVPTIAQHKGNESWNRYHPEDVWNTMCQHSHYTGVMNPGIITIRRKFGTLCANTRTTWYKWGICQELPPHKQGIHRRKGIPPTHLLVFRSVRSKLAENPSNSNNSRISSFKSYILTIPTFLKI